MSVAPQNVLWNAPHLEFKQLLFDEQALVWAQRRSADATLAAIRNNSLAGVPELDWSAGQADISAFFGLSATSHCLTVEPHLWVDLLEPQITRGLVHFLKTGSRSARISKTWSLLKALWPDEPSPELQPLLPVEAFQRANAMAEADAGHGRRIDVVAWLLAADRTRFGAVIEAKFGHHLTANQLKAYETAAADAFELPRSTTAFVVVAPAFTRATAKDLRTHANWRFVSWQRFIVRLEAALAEAGGDDLDFARFRRTAWHRASN